MIIKQNEDGTYPQVNIKTRLIIKGQTCKNCKWMKKHGKYFDCVNENNTDPLTGCYMGIPGETFGCPQWEARDE